ncbi:hypothetical protein ACIP6V_23925 [Streptomyces sp. NPDC088770]|uniref:hypothetical protein n=1 Tax=unclassified Streptomyces TaxID=2593676 RepID=UPI002DDAAF01|nr:hypothetical protein [Streptomyces sp. NBC_01788]WSB29727.1 hypothetical protein OIE49_29695 [Streptomyces sp. NBC_01788]
MASPSPSRVPQLIDNYLARLAAAPGLSGVKIVDGPLVSLSGAREWLFVGYDGDPEGEANVASTTQTWAGLGARAKNEEIQLTCAILVRRGSTAVRPLRDRAFAIFAEAEAVVRADPSLGLPPPTVCSITETAFSAPQTDKGIEGRLAFTLATLPTRI